MPKLKLIFGTHNTIPVGAPEEDIERIYQNAFKPFLSVLYNFPDVAFTLQYSGSLLSWLDKKHSEFTDVLMEMISRKQIEVLGGAFYDPILTVIPRSDRLGQVESLTTYLRKRFGRRPRGGWITEMEWEPSLASTLNSCGMDYVFLGDFHFKSAGLDPNGLYSPCLTEDQGKTLTVFPLAEEATLSFPYMSPEKNLETLKSMGSDQEERLVCMLIDGTLLGGCERSRSANYAEKRLEKFLKLISENSDSIETIHPGRYLRQSTPVRKAYFPCGSNENLMTATMSPVRHKKYSELKSVLQGHKLSPEALFGGGYFRHFLTRYPESNQLYAKMQYTHILVNGIRGDKYRKSSALEELWKGQYGAVYWPSPGGGLYDNSLRKSAFRSLISAEKVTREKGVFISSIVTSDFDMDSRIEYLFQGNEMNAYIHTCGAVLFELDYLPVSWNYLDTMARHPEQHHPKGESSRGYDTYSRRAFIDHFFDADTGIDSFDSMSFKERGNFIDAPFEVIKCDREHSELVLEKSGTVVVGKHSYPVRLLKKFIFKRASINLYYTIKNLAETPLDLIFGSETNLSFLSKGVESLRIYRQNGKDRTIIEPEKTCLEALNELSFEDVVNEAVVNFSTLEPAECWSLPVETLSGNEQEERFIYQSSCIVPRWKISLQPQESWENRLTLRMEKLQPGGT